MFERIVVPLDGTEFAEQAVDTARGLATLTGAPIHLVGVVDARALTRMCDVGALRDEERDFERMRETADTCDYLDRMRGTLDRAGFSVTSACRRGFTIAELAASTRPGDVIVIATHAGANRPEQGSVTWDLIGTSPVPVVVVRPMAPAPDAVARAAGCGEQGRLVATPTAGARSFEPW